MYGWILDKLSRLRSLCPDFQFRETEKTEEQGKIDLKANYYDEGGLRTLDIIKSKLTKEQYRGFLLGNILKYSCRMNWKGQDERDTEKITVYSKHLGDEDV